MGKERARLLGVGVNLAGQRGHVRVAFLVAELVQKLNGDALAVDRVVEIENEHFEQWPRIRLDRGPHTKARNARARRWPEPVNAHGEYAGQRRFAAERNVRRRKAQMPAKLVAMCNAARHRERPAEQCGRVRKIAVSQRGTHNGA